MLESMDAEIVKLEKLLEAIGGILSVNERERGEKE
jgi:hypothetical protein